MNQDDPRLTLDDLVVFPSPTAPQFVALHDADSDSVVPCPPRASGSSSPDLSPESDIVQMRRRVAEMRHIDESDTQLTPREEELAEMVLRLTSVVRPDSSDQLLRQADTISALMQQRDMLLIQAEEQQLRWNAEKDGWARMAEALLAQQAKIRLASERDEDIERFQAAETDNKSLRRRLNETQSRLQMLESELTKIRPLLLMQPLISRSSTTMPLPPPTPNSKSQPSRGRKKDTAATTEDDLSDGEPLIDPLDTPQTSQSQATPRVKQPRKPEAPNNVNFYPAGITQKQRRPSHRAALRGLSADARVELLVLAARKIGKHRAGIMSGMVQHLEEVERERRREESATTAVATTPKTPKRHATYAGYPPEGGYVYMNGQMRPTPGMQPVPLFIPAYPHLLQTPSSSTTVPSVTSSVQKPKQDTRTNNPPTPLDSLLSAARTMMRGDVVDVMVDEDDVVSDSPDNSAGTRNKDTFGSPVPKRRKVASRTGKLSASKDLFTDTNRATANSASPASAVNVGASELGLGRVRSGLDVLADQAAAFSTQGQTQSQPKGKGKEKAADIQSQQEPGNSAPKPRGRTRSRGKEPEAGTPSSAMSASRSRSRIPTPRSDLGDGWTGSTSTTVDAAGSASEAQVDPGGGGGMSSVDILNQISSQSLDSVLGFEGDRVTSTSQDAPSPPSRTSPPSLSADDPVDAEIAQRRGSRAQSVQSENGSRAATVRPNPLPVIPPIQDNESRGASSQHQWQQHPDTTTAGGESGNNGSSGSAHTVSTAQARNKELVRVAEQDAVVTSAAPAKRQRSPYVKWSKEEDELLAQAVAKYGPKWDLVQKALPSRGYHQVRQRWLRKMGVFDSKPDLSSFQTAAAMTFASTSSRGEGAGGTGGTGMGGSGEPRGNLKLGLAPLSSDRALSGLVRRSSPSTPS